jgi:putative serine protease PepD
MAAETNGDALDASQIYESVADGVVEIAVSGTAGEGPFGETVRGQGSGFVYDDQGHVVTNYHVVEGATSVEVTLADGSSHPARVVGSDPSTDLAVLEVDAPPGALQPLAIGDSDALQVGEPVVAIGSPFGLDATVTSGIVSAVDRRITAPNGFAIDEAIQTDAAINKGNSGGPLLNSRAEVVGVNSQIETESGGNVGIGFAVPTSTVQEVVSQILETGSVEHAFLGVGVATVPADAADELGAAAGVAVTEVRDGSPAAEAGLRPATGSRSVDGVPYPTGGDVVTAVAGTEIATAEELQDAIDEHAPGDQVDLTVVRGGETLTVTVTLGTRPS